MVPVHPNAGQSCSNVSSYEDRGNDGKREELAKVKKKNRPTPNWDRRRRKKMRDDWRMESLEPITGQLRAVWSWIPFLPASANQRTEWREKSFPVYSTSEASLSERGELLPFTRMYWTWRLSMGEEAPQEQSWLENRFSMSSSCRPWVSGRQPRTKKRPNTTRPVYMKNAPGGEIHMYTVK